MAQPKDLLSTSINDSSDQDESFDFRVAREMLERVPRVMHRVRSEMRTVAKGQMTIAQLRILARLYQDVYTMTELAEWQGVSAPAMSKMIDVLEHKAWVGRTPHAHDRRQIGIRMTTEGKKLFLSLRKAVRGRFVDQIKTLSDADKEVLSHAFKILASIYP